ncbi:hypothetical protein A3F65_03485 [Candidatus Saccharibacteria bacterium RIFCSPHIGHO2_12_FULL_47_16b]|nr:MAG: hypothetical protein A3F65_03485 [Candidatus Saccharibacteria bacterium RIFCSPHIGHO2_12_FULL_47_16b]
MKLFKKPNQRGLGLLEWLLLLIILILLGFIGWYVFTKSSDTKNKYDETAQAGNQPATTTKYLEFKEYGVKIPLSNDLDGLTYAAETVGGYTYLYMTTSALKKSMDACNADPVTASGYSFHALSKTDGQYPVEPTMDSGTLLKQFDKFYIGGSVPNGMPCLTDDSKNTEVMAKMQSLQKALTEAFKTAVEIK